MSKKFDLKERTAWKFKLYFIGFLWVFSFSQLWAQSSAIEVEVSDCRPLIHSSKIVGCGNLFYEGNQIDLGGRFLQLAPVSAKPSALEEKNFLERLWASFGKTNLTDDTPTRWTVEEPEDLSKDGYNRLVMGYLTRANFDDVLRLALIDDTERLKKRTAEVFLSDYDLSKAIERDTIYTPEKCIRDLSVEQDPHSCEYIVFYSQSLVQNYVVGGGGKILGRELVKIVKKEGPKAIGKSKHGKKILEKVGLGTAVVGTGLVGTWIAVEISEPGEEAPKIILQPKSEENSPLPIKIFAEERDLVKNNMQSPIHIDFINDLEVMEILKALMNLDHQNRDEILKRALERCANGFYPTWLCEMLEEELSKYIVISSYQKSQKMDFMMTRLRYLAYQNSDGNLVVFVFIPGVDELHHDVHLKIQGLYPWVVFYAGGYVLPGTGVSIDSSTMKQKHKSKKDGPSDPEEASEFIKKLNKLVKEVLDGSGIEDYLP